jgi:hypothetical protein
MTTGEKSLEPLLVRPRDAWRMLGVGNTRGYQLLKAGELETFKDGRSRKITVASMRAYIARKLVTPGATGAATQATPPRKRGRPRKTPLTPEARA